LAVAILQSALLTIRHWEPWENLDLAREPPLETVWEPLGYTMILNFADVQLYM